MTFVLVTVTLLVLLGRLFQLQVVHGQVYRQRADANRLRTVIIPAPRGDIVDAQGKILAQNTPDFSLTITAADLPSASAERQQTLTTIGAVIDQTPDHIKQTLASAQLPATEPTTIIEHVPYQQALQWMVALNHVTGVTVQPLPTRSYPGGASLAPLMGYIGRVSPADLARQPTRSPLDQTGKTGLENQYNDQLTGVDGLQVVERDVHNQAQQIIRQQTAEPGHTLVTNINLGLQQELYVQLSAAITKVKSPGGAAVAIDPNTGHVLALVSFPSYDDNWFVSSGHSADVSQVLTDPSKPLLDRAIAGQYPSGSIIKPILATAALTEGTITPTSTVVSTGGIKVGNDFFPDWKAGGHGLTNVIKAIADSVNTFFYAVAGGDQGIPALGVDRMVQYLSTFGWGKKLGIDLPGEANGFLPTAAWRATQRSTPWRLGDTYHLGIGQGDLEVTPIQIATSMAAIANGGTLYQPQIVNHITDPSGRVIKQFPPQVLRAKVAPASSLATVQAGMRAGVLTGSSRELLSLPVTSAGKTGTAQFGNQGQTHGWYTAYAPYDHPQIVLAIIVEAAGGGDVTAEPVARNVLQWYFAPSGSVNTKQP